MLEFDRQFDFVELESETCNGTFCRYRYGLTNIGVGVSLLLEIVPMYTDFSPELPSHFFICPSLGRLWPLLFPRFEYFSVSHDIS